MVSSSQNVMSPQKIMGSGGGHHHGQGKLNIQNVRNLNNNSNVSGKENSMPPKRPFVPASDNNGD